RSKSIALPALRRALEAAQAGYLTEVFAGAAIDWDLRYFEKRLGVGATHDRIKLPFKWYIGAYTEYYRLLAAYLRRDVDDMEKIARVEAAAMKVFNLDLQAIGDSFLLATLGSVFEAMGLTLDAAGIEGDKSSQIHKVKAFILEQFSSFTGN